MELREFVKTSLLDVLVGINDAQQELLKHEGRLGVVNPQFKGKDLLMEHMQFDVAVTTATTEKGEAKGGINVYAAKLGGDLSHEDQNSAVSRLTFRVPFVASAIEVRP